MNRIREILGKLMAMFGELPVVMRFKYWRGICQAPGCWVPGVECWMNYWEDVTYEDEFDNGTEGKPDYFYCPKHAAEEGFCWYCGNFCAGTEDFDFSPIRGVCGNCIVEFEECHFEDGYEPQDEFEEGDNYEVA